MWKGGLIQLRSRAVALVWFLEGVLKFVRAHILRLKCIVLTCSDHWPTPAPTPLLTLIDVKNNFTLQVPSRRFLQIHR